MMIWQTFYQNLSTGRLEHSFNVELEEDRGSYQLFFTVAERHEEEWGDASCDPVAELTRLCEVDPRHPLAYQDLVVDVASKLGPLFGPPFPAVRTKRESLIAWCGVARVLAFAADCSDLSKKYDAEIDFSIFASAIVEYLKTPKSKRIEGWRFSAVLKVGCCTEYTDYLFDRSVDSLASGNPVPNLNSKEVEGRLHATFQPVDAKLLNLGSFSVGVILSDSPITLGAGGGTQDLLGDYYYKYSDSIERLVAKDASKIQGIRDDEMVPVQVLLDMMVQHLTAIHLNWVRLGWSALREGVRTYSILEPQFTDHLSYIWFTLAEAHAQRRVGRCPACNTRFVLKGRSDKVYCSKKCRGTAYDRKHR